MFLFMDDTQYAFPNVQLDNDSERIVELTDVGCDTEAIYPLHYPYNNLDGHRREAEDFKLARRFVKRHSDKPNDIFTRAMTLSNDYKMDRRDEHYIRKKSRYNNYSDNDVYTYDSRYHSYTNEPHSDFIFRKKNSLLYNRSEYKDNYYTEFPSPKRIKEYSRSNHASRCKQRCERMYQRNNAFRQLLEDCNENYTRSKRSPSDKHTECTKTFSIIDEDFHRDSNYSPEFVDCPNIMEWQKPANNFPNVPDSTPKKRLRDSSPLKSSSNFEEPATWTNPKILKSQLTAEPLTENSHNLNSYQMHESDDSNREKFMKIRKRKSREKMSSKIPVESARSSAINAAMKKSKISRPTLFTTNSLRVHDERISNVFPMGKSFTKTTRLDSTVKAKETKIESSIPRKFTHDHQRREKFVNNSAKPRSETNGFSKIHSVKSTQFLKSHKRAYKGSEIHSTVSKIGPSNRMEAKVKQNKKISRLPIRTWKRMKSKQPVIL